MLDRDRIIFELRARQADLRVAGVKHLALFGSVARGTAREASDIDLAADYADGLDLFDMGGIAADIAEVLGTDNFDLADRARLKPAIKQCFDHEHICIF